MSKIPKFVDFSQCPDLSSSIRWAATQQGAEGLTELLRATAAKRICLITILHHRVDWSPRQIRSKLPIVVLIGDDRGESKNPDEWRCSMTAIAWARSAIVHGCGAEAWHYQHAILAAEITGRCLFVETDSDHVAAWVAAIAPRGIPGLSIIPRAGQKHPMPAH